MTTVNKRGPAVVESATGARLELSNAASAAGFNPLDLLYASLSGCLALSARIAASELGLFERFEAASVTVTGEKIDSEFSRITAMDVHLKITGMLDDAEKAAIAERAERICTVSNTLRDGVQIRFA